MLVMPTACKEKLRASVPKEVESGVVNRGTTRQAVPGEWSFSIGDERPESGGGEVQNISEIFSPEDATKLYDVLNSEEFLSRLKKYAGDEPVPKIRFSVSIFERGPYQERTVQILQRPMLSPGGHQRGLFFGLAYQVEIEVMKLDRGEPINYHYKNPLTGEELPPHKRELPREPRCDFSLRDSGKEWVFFDGK